MAGIQHAMLVNDVCGAPLRRNQTQPWLYFDGKLLQYKLIRAGRSMLDLCDGQVRIPQLSVSSLLFPELDRTLSVAHSFVV